MYLLVPEAQQTNSAFGKIRTGHRPCISSAHLGGLAASSAEQRFSKPVVFDRFHVQTRLREGVVVVSVKPSRCSIVVTSLLFAACTPLPRSMSAQARNEKLAKRYSQPSEGPGCPGRAVRSAETEHYCKP